MNNFLIVLLGPTGVGKSDASIKIASHFSCDIISSDSRQFFSEMKIGTAVPTEKQLASVKHHFIRFLQVNEYYSSSLFERDVLKLLPSLFGSKNVALMTGGSGMYIDAVCNGIDDIPDTDPEIRQKWMKRYEDGGIEGLRSELKILDPEHFSRVDLNNYKRILRALEICETTGLPYSSFLKKEKRQRDFTTIKVGLQRDRDELYSRIDERVDGMLEAGLEEEARLLCPFRNLNALNSVGYREFFDYFDGTITREEAVRLIKRNSRRYAKRQITWWSKDKDITWFHPDQVREIISFIEERKK
jgi:tRNA dimethylallyltransferase